MGVGDYVACLQRARAEWQRLASRRKEGLLEEKENETNKPSRKEDGYRQEKGNARGKRASGHQFENRRRPWARTTSGGSVDPVEVRRYELSPTRTTLKQTDDYSRRARCPASDFLPTAFLLSSAGLFPLGIRMSEFRT